MTREHIREGAFDDELYQSLSPQEQRAYKELWRRLAGNGSPNSDALLLHTLVKLLVRAPLQWTREPPTAEGPYWLRDHLRCRTYLAHYQEWEVWILERDDGEETHAEPVAKFGPERWEWSGPLVPPP